MVLGLMHSDPKDRMDAYRNSDRFSEDDRIALEGIVEVMEQMMEG